MRIGYARCSTAGQDTQAQVDLLVIEYEIDPKRVYIDHGFSGKTMTRDGLEKARAALRSGDEFVVPNMSRLARNVTDALGLMKELTDEGVRLNVGGVIYDPADPMSKLFLTILAAVAEAEGGWVSLRTKEAMARPSVRGKLRGKQAKLTPKQDAIIAQHVADGLLAHREIAALFNIARSGVYRAVERHEARQEQNRHRQSVDREQEIRRPR